jgi:hypothetical protein
MMCSRAEAVIFATVGSLPMTSLPDSQAHESLPVFVGGNKTAMIKVCSMGTALLRLSS